MTQTHTHSLVTLVSLAEAEADSDREVSQNQDCLLLNGSSFEDDDLLEEIRL